MTLIKALKLHDRILQVCEGNPQLVRLGDGLDDGFIIQFG